MPQLPSNNIVISTGTIVRAILLVLLAAFLYFIRDTVLVLLTAVVIASAIEPAAKYFQGWRLPRILAVLLTYLIAGTIVVTVIYFVAPLFVNEVSGLLTYLSGALGPFTPSTTSFSITSLNSSSIGSFIEGSQNFINALSHGAWSTLIGISGGVVDFVLILVLSFYLAVRETGVEDFLEIITPPRHQAHVMAIWSRSKEKIGKWMQGQLVLALIIGVLAYLGLTILGIRYAFTLAIAAAFFEIIPVFGPILAALPAVGVAYLGGVVPAVEVAGLFLIIQQFENHLIYPLVVRKVIGVPPLLVIIGLIIGAEIAGFLGVVLSVPIAVVFQELAHDIQRGRHEHDVVK